MDTIDYGNPKSAIRNPQSRSLFFALSMSCFPQKLATACFLVLLLSRADWGQEPAKEVKDKIDQAIQSAYQTASAGFPCKLKSKGKPKMLRWEEVDRCLNSAAERVDWDALRRELESLRAASRVSAEEFRGTVESGLSHHALTYERAFAVKNPEALLPLTNSLLKFLPAKSIIKAGNWFRRYGYWVLLANRFLSGIRSVISIVSGVYMLPWLGVLALALLSCGAWNGLLIWVGYALGQNWKLIEDILRQYNRVLFSVLILGGAFWLVRRKLSTPSSR